MKEETSQSKFIQEIVDRARAGYPGIAVPTMEPVRVEVAALGAAKLLKPGYGVRRWSLTEGWKLLTKEEGKPPEARDPVSALEYVFTGENKAFYLMHVFTEFFQDPTLRQRLRDALEHAKEKNKVILLVGDIELPKDVAASVAELKLGLPDRAELEDLVRRLCTAAKLQPPTNGNLQAAVDAALGLTYAEAENAFSLSLVTRAGKVEPSVVYEAKKEIVSRNGVLEYVEANETMDDIGGWDQAKGWTRARSKGFTRQAREFGLEAPKGVLLYGIQGNAKGLLPKALKTEWQLPLIRMNVGALFGSLIGESEGKLRQALQVVGAVAPAILWIDECDKALGSGDNDGGTTNRVMAELLTWLQERDQAKPVFVVLTANDPSKLRPELIRRGRIDEIFFVDLPSKAERRDIFRIHLSKPRRKCAGLATEANLEVLAGASGKFTGAEIEQAVKDGMWIAYAAGRATRMEDVLAAVKATTPLADFKSEEIKALQAWGQGRARPVSTPEADAGGANEIGLRSLQLEEPVTTR